MQRRVLLAAGAALLVVAGFMALRSATHRQASRALDQGIGALVDRLPPGYAVRHGATEYNPLTSALSVHDVVVTHDGAPLWTASLVTISGADGQALQDVFDPASYPNGHPAWSDRRLLIADASVEGLHVGGAGAKDGDLVIRSASLHRLSGRPFMLPPTPENRGRPDFAADAGLALAVDTLRENDATLTIRTPQHGTPQPAKQAVTLSVGSAAVNNYDSGKFGSVALKAMALDVGGTPKAAPFRVEAASFDVRDGSLRSLLETARRTGHLDRSQLGAAVYVSADLTGVALTGERAPLLALHDIHVVPGLSENGSANGLAWVHGLTIGVGHAPVPPQAARSIAAFGADSITADFDATSQIEAGGKQMDVHEDIVLRDLGTLHVQGLLTGYDAALNAPGNPMAGFAAATLTGATLSFKDNSLTGRLLAVAAAQADTTPEALRGGLARPVMALGMMVPDQPDAAQQVIAFLDHPNVLTVTAQPPQPVTLGAVAAAPLTTRAHLLGLHIEAK
jgi:hypothetical protein